MLEIVPDPEWLAIEQRLAAMPDLVQAGRP